MNQKRFRWLFASTLALALFMGIFALASSPALAAFEPACPSTICSSTAGLAYDGWCNYYEPATDCLFRCYKYKSTGGPLSYTCRAANCFNL